MKKRLVAGCTILLLLTAAISGGLVATEPDGQSGSATTIAALEARLAQLEARVAALESASELAPSTATVTAAPPTPATTSTPPAAGPVTTASLPASVPEAVRRTLQREFPEAAVLTVGHDRDDGYWWFEVPQGRWIIDIEIAADGTVIDRDRERR